MNDGFSDVKNLADNPYLKVPSNATNFEFRTLYSHLFDNSEENPLEFFKGYLKLKAQNYHTKLKEFLETLSFDKISTSDFPKEKIDTAQSDLKSAINYEDLIKKALQNPDDDIVKVELARRVTVESIKHLSKNARFIDDIDENGDLTLQNERYKGESGE